MREDEVTSIHEAAPEVVAVSGRWTKLAGPVAIDRDGGGDVVMSTDVETIRRTLLADPGFDRELPRIELIGALLAGPIAERMLRERGRTESSERDLSAATHGDREVIRAQIEQIAPPRPGLLEQVERDVRRRLEQPAVWGAIERFARILLERRRLEADEATAILAGILPANDAEGMPAVRMVRWASIATLILVGAAITAVLRLLA